MVPAPLELLLATPRVPRAEPAKRRVCGPTTALPTYSARIAGGRFVMRDGQAVLRRRVRGCRSKTEGVSPPRGLIRVPFVVGASPAACADSRDPHRDPTED
jgi:hypothetical protein